LPDCTEPEDEELGEFIDDNITIPRWDYGFWGRRGIFTPLGGRKKYLIKGIRENTQEMGA